MEGVLLHAASTHAHTHTCCLEASQLQILDVSLSLGQAGQLYERLYRNHGAHQLRQRLCKQLLGLSASLRFRDLAERDYLERSS